MKFEIYFFLVPMENCFPAVLFQATIYIRLSFKINKKNCKVLKIILVPDACPLKTEIARLSIGYRLKY